eukprot:753296-Hanusia_phi.AAC.2
MSLLLDKHELDWEAMVMDADLNSYRYEEVVPQDAEEERGQAATEEDGVSQGVPVPKREEASTQIQETAGDQQQFLGLFSPQLLAPILLSSSLSLLLLILRLFIPRPRTFPHLLSSPLSFPCMTCMLQEDKRQRRRAVEYILSSEGAENPLRLSNATREGQLESGRELVQVFLQHAQDGKETPRAEMKIEGLRVVMGFNLDELDGVMECGEETSAPRSFPHLLSNTSHSSSSNQIVEVGTRPPRKFALCEEEIGSNGRPSSLLLPDGSKLPVPSFLRPGFRFSRQPRKQKKAGMRI